MPIYEYACEACGKQTEILQKISDPAPSTCESCGKGPMTKLMSKSAFILKGQGWYVTDFRDKKPSSNSTATTDSTPASSASTTSPAPAASSSPPPSSATPSNKND